MKKNVLALAVTASVASMAMAQNPIGVGVDPGKTGEVLIYPFYTADAGNDTFIHIANTTDVHKAVKVRILEAENSVEVRDFNLYLSPKDHFSFVLTAGGNDGAARLVTGDNSCTVPRIKADDEPTGEITLTNLAYSEAFGVDDTNQSPERTLNGYVEIIEMGQFFGPVAANWTHGADGMPADCDALTELWTQGGTWAVQAETDNVGFEGEIEDAWLGGGLYGLGMVINVENGTSFGYDATALDGFVDPLAAVGTAELHFPPGNTRPALGGMDALVPSLATFSYHGHVSVSDGVDEFFIGPAAIDWTAAGRSASLDAVSAVLMTDGIQNDYVIDPDLAATTDWMITFPTKRWYAQEADLAGWLPFTTAWDGDEACEPFRLTAYDREERFRTNTPNEPQFSPFQPGETPDLQLCYEANVVSMVNDADAPMGAVYGDGSDVTESTTRIWAAAEPTYVAGWADISFNWADLIDTYAFEGHIMSLPGFDDALVGLPAVGFAVIEYTNGTLAGGTLANYASAHDHKTNQVVSVEGSFITRDWMQ